MSLLDNWVAIVFLIAAVALIALAGGYLLQMLIARRQADVFALNLESELAKVEQKQRELIAEATNQANALRKNVEKQASDQRGEIRQRNREAKRREQRLDRRSENLEKREQELLRRESDLAEQQKQLSERQADHAVRLEEVAQLTHAQARTQLMEKVTEESRELADQIVRGAEEQARQEADLRARWLVSNSLQRVASAVTQSSTTSAVKLPGDESKGQIIGREGRNIRAFEAITGVDLLIDDTPETVTLSSHDPIRREIARRTLSSLIEDGRVHPVSIEQHFNRARVAVRKSIREAGERACFEAKVPKLHQELVLLLGQLNYRQSYGQNVLSHSVEVAHLAGVLAGEMGADS
ncbi:MAG: Rnase Y domain-containing protein, partial [Chloroflexota bacterium]|nr:Rnase Y domain-containing protein [Chloroflexota bacterium]